MRALYSSAAMSEAAEHPTRRSQSANTRRYDRIARFYATFELLYLIFLPARRRAVAALGLKAGDTVLEIGAGTGRNFSYLVDEVGRPGPSSASIPRRGCWPRPAT